MLTSKPIQKLVFLDIESQALYKDFIEMPKKLQRLFSQQWSWKIDEVAYRYHVGGEQEPYLKAQQEVFAEKGHLSPEYAKVLCISAGIIMDDFKFKCASFAGEEKDLLTRFLANKASFIHQGSHTKADERKSIVCYNGKAWDIPFLTKRLMYNGFELPASLELENLKPWEILHIVDPKESLKFGGMDAPSLEMLCTQLGIETAEDKLGEPNFAGKTTEQIAEHCETDVLALAQCYLKLIRSKEHPNGIQNQLTKI